MCVCVGFLPHSKKIIAPVHRCLYVCERRNGPTKFLEKRGYHMYIGVGWSELFMSLFTFLPSGVVVTTLWIVLLAGLNFYKCVPRWWHRQSVLPAARGLCIFFLQRAAIRFNTILRSILGWLVVCGGFGCCFCCDNCHSGSGSIDKRRSTLN